MKGGHKTNPSNHRLCQIGLILHPKDKMPLDFPETFDSLKPKVEQFCSDAAGDETWLLKNMGCMMHEMLSLFGINPPIQFQNRIDRIQLIIINHQSHYCWLW